MMCVPRPLTEESGREYVDSIFASSQLSPPSVRTSMHLVKCRYNNLWIVDHMEYLAKKERELFTLLYSREHQTSQPPSST